MYRSLLVPLDGSSFAEQALPLAAGDLRPLGRRACTSCWFTTRSPPCRATANAALLDQSIDRCIAAAGGRVPGSRGAPARRQRRRGHDPADRRAGRPQPRGLCPRRRGSSSSSSPRMVGACSAASGSAALPTGWCASSTCRCWSCGRMPPAARRPPRCCGMIVVPLDGSPLAEAVLEPAMQLGELLGAEFILYRAVVELPPDAQLPYPAVMLIPEQTEVTSVLEQQAAAISTIWRGASRARPPRRDRGRGDDRSSGGHLDLGRAPWGRPHCPGDARPRRRYPASPRERGRQAAALGERATDRLAA